MIGLCGANGTGKTTLAQAFAEKHNMKFVKTTASAVFELLGLDPRKDYPFGIRIIVQEQILASLEEQYRMAGFQFIADRTPIDVLAYTMAEVTRESLTDDEIPRFLAHMEECFRVTNEQFTNLLLLQPGIPLEQNREGKAPSNMAYIEHLNSLMLGLVVSEKLQVAHHYIPRSILELDRRIECIENAHRSTVQNFNTKMQDLKDSGLRFH